MEARSKNFENKNGVCFEIEVGRHKTANMTMTTLSFEDIYNTKMGLMLNDDDDIVLGNESLGNLDSLQINFYGDDQSEMLIEALEFAVKSLKELNQSIEDGSI